MGGRTINDVPSDIGKEEGEKRRIYSPSVLQQRGIGVDLRRKKYDWEDFGSRASKRWERGWG